MIFDAVPTEAQTLASLGLREQEMRYVTQHFKDLQGLKAVPIVAGMLLILYLVPRGHKQWEPALLIICGLLLLAFLWVKGISRWYRERYGMVTATAARPEMEPGYAVVLFLLLAMGIGCAISLLGSPVSGNALFTAGIFLLPKCFFAVPVSSTIRLRRMLYVAGMLAVTGSVLYLTFTHVRSGIAIYTELWAFLLLSLYDHWLLDRLLRLRRRALGQGRRKGQSWCRVCLRRARVKQGWELRQK